MDDGGRIVYAQVELKSSSEGCSGNNPMEMSAVNTQDFSIPYSYSVRYKENNNIKWASRWDYILNTIQTTKIQWFSILNSLVIVLFLSGMVAMILLRTIHKDLAKYNSAQVGVSLNLTIFFLISFWACFSSKINVKCCFT